VDVGEDDEVVELADGVVEVLLHAGRVASSATSNTTKIPITHPLRQMRFITFPPLFLDRFPISTSPNDDLEYYIPSVPVKIHNIWVVYQFEINNQPNAKGI
jgi:hypothetical protein